MPPSPLSQVHTKAMDLPSGVLDTLPLGVVVTDGDGRVVLLNRWFERFSGLCRDTHTGHVLPDAWPPWSGLNVAAEITAAAQGEDVRSRTGTMDLPDRPRDAWVRLHFHPLQQDEHSGWALILVEDVSEQHQVLEERDQLFATLFHDLRSPLAAMANFSEYLIEEHDEAPDLRRDLSEISRTCRDIVLMVEDTSQRMAGGKSALELVDLAELTGQVCRQMLHHPRARERALHLFGENLSSSGQQRSPAIPVYTNPATAGRAIRNLLDNALRYAHDNVFVDLQTGEDGTRLTIEDDGPGIPKGHENTIFDKGVQAPGALPGTGLGLHQVWRWAREHDGGIRVESSDLGGARFVIHLPHESSR